jgi:hypothetical protein
MRAESRGSGVFAEISVTSLSIMSPARAKFEQVDTLFTGNVLATACQFFGKDGAA